MRLSPAATRCLFEVVRRLPRRRLSRWLGRLAEVRLPAPVRPLTMAALARLLGARLDECPADAEYATVDAFFTRKLRPGARPIAPASLVSPCDGELQDGGRVAPGATIVAKGRHYSATELAGFPEARRLYGGGSYVVIYLSPGDYHRVHAPVDGHLIEVITTPGDLYPVNLIGQRHVPDLLIVNQRVALVVESTDHGRVTIVMVGAMAVGRIEIAGLACPPGRHQLQVPRKIERGDEIGTFHLGSTTVVLVPTDVNLDRSLRAVRLGESLLKTS